MDKKDFLTSLNNYYDYTEELNNKLYSDFRFFNYNFKNNCQMSKKLINKKIEELK
jgi:hypothetical protein